jgi:hypothetical protein
LILFGVVFGNEFLICDSQNVFRDFIAFLHTKFSNSIFEMAACDLISYLDCRQLDPSNFVIGQPPSDWIIEKSKQLILDNHISSESNDYDKNKTSHHFGSEYDISKVEYISKDSPLTSYEHLISIGSIVLVNVECISSHEKYELLSLHFGFWIFFIFCYIFLR